MPANARFEVALRYLDLWNVISIIFRIVILKAKDSSHHRNIINNFISGINKNTQTIYALRQKKFFRDVA